MFFGIFLNFLAIDPNLGRNIGRNRNVGLRFLIQAVIMRNGTAAKRKNTANKKNVLSSSAPPDIDDCLTLL